MKIIGEAADQTAIAELKAGKNAAWTGFDPVYSTYQMMDAMLRNAEGMPVSTAAGAGAADPAVDAVERQRYHELEPADENTLAQFEKLWNVS